MISFLEGNSSFRDIEHEFNVSFVSGWRCIARVTGPGQFVMMLPNAKEVERTFYLDKRMEIKTFDGVLNVGGGGGNLC